MIIKKEYRDFYILWITQSLSLLGSQVTEFALTLWLYEKTGAALSTAALTIFTYLPYVMLSMVAGAYTDRADIRKLMLICDTIAAASSAIVLMLYQCNTLAIWHLYVLNVLSGIMNTVQQPASEVAYTMVMPKEFYQRGSGLLSLSRSSVTIGAPIISAMLYGVAGLKIVILFDLFTFLTAFFALFYKIRFHGHKRENRENGDVLIMGKEGMRYLLGQPLLLWLILFMACVNFISSAFNATLPAMILPNPKGGNQVLGIVNACAGIAMVAGSVWATKVKKPRDRVKIIYLTMCFSLGTENFLLSFSRTPVIWCVGQILGWILVPVMSVNLNVILRNSIPVEYQGRVYACRNSLQYFTVPLGLFFGGYMVDRICEPFMMFMIKQPERNIFCTLFGEGKGAGASMMLFLLGISGVLMCLAFGNKLRNFKYMEM